MTQNTQTYWLCVFVLRAIDVYPKKVPTEEHGEKNG